MMSYDQLIQFNMRAEMGYITLVLMSIVVAVILSRVNFPLKLPELNIKWIMLAGLALRVPPLFQSFWYDETFTGVIARLSPDEAWSVIQSDVHPPLFYALQWLIAHTINSSEMSLRLLPLIFGVWAIYAMYQLGKLWSEQAAQGAALLMAVAPVMLWFSVEARQYTLLLLVVLWGVRYILLGRYRPLAGVLFILPWLHSYGYIYAGLMGLYALYKRVPLRWLALSSVGGLAWLPYLLHQSRDVADGFWTPPMTIGGAFKILSGATIGSKFPPEWAMFMFLPVLAVTLLAIYRARRETLLMLLIVGVPLSATVLSVLWSPIYLIRAMLPVGALLILIIAIHFERKAVYLLVIVPFIASSLWVATGQTQRANMRDYVAACGDSPIYVMSTSNAIIARYYSDAPITVFPESGNRDQWLSDTALDAIGFQRARYWTLPEGWCLFFVDSPATTAEQRLTAWSMREGWYTRLYTHELMLVEVTNG